MQQQLFDLSLRHQNRQRYHKNQQDYDFLYHRASEDIELRLHGICREFPTALNLNAQNRVIASVLQRAPNVGKVINIDSFGLDQAKADEQNDYILCPDDVLPFESQSADLVVSALNLHYINDLPSYLAQIRMILKPDGLFLGALCGGQTLSELRTVLMQAEEERTGGVSPRVIPFAHIKDMGSLLQRAGFALPVTDIDSFTVQYDTMFHLMKDLKGMGAANILFDRKKTPTPKAVFMRAAELYQEQFSSNGRINASCEIIHLTGWSPSPDQPQPLKPGSAKMSMAKAVGKKA